MAMHGSTEGKPTAADLLQKFHDVATEAGSLVALVRQANGELPLSPMAGGVLGDGLTLVDRAQERLTIVIEVARGGAASGLIPGSRKPGTPTGKAEDAELQGFGMLVPHPRTGDDPAADETASGTEGDERELPETWQALSACVDDLPSFADEITEILRQSEDVPAIWDDLDLRMGASAFRNALQALAENAREVLALHGPKA